LTKQKLQILSCVPCVVIPTNTVPIDFVVFIVSPLHPKYGQVRRDISPEAEKGFEWTQTEDDEGDGVQIVHVAE